MSKDRWSTWLWLILVVLMGLCYFTHPARDLNLKISFDKWKVVTDQWRIDR